VLAASYDCRCDSESIVSFPATGLLLVIEI
jgi:hypothetical protein